MRSCLQSSLGHLELDGVKVRIATGGGVLRMRRCCRGGDFPDGFKLKGKTYEQMLRGSGADKRPAPSGRGKKTWRY
jgi:hypothetical protein